MRTRRPTLEEVTLAVDCFVAARLSDARPIEAAPWIEELEARSALRFPPSFRVLATRFAFAPFDAGGVRLWGNRGIGDPDDLDVAPLKDRHVARCLFERGFLPIGRPLGNRDPIAFEVRAGGATVESAIVQLDHARIVQHGEIQIVRRVAPTFLALVED